MKRTSPILMSLVLATLMCGCYTTGLSRRERGVDTFSTLAYELQATQDPVRSALPSRLPARLAVAQIGELAPSPELSTALRCHPETVHSLVELPLQGDTLPRHYARTPEDTSWRQRASQLREMARQQDADYLLVVGGNMDVALHTYPWIIFDLALIPAVILPSHKVSITIHATGALVHVADGHVITFVHASSSTNALSATAQIDQTTFELAETQRTSLGEQLADGVIRQLNPDSGISQSPTRPFVAHEPKHYDWN